MENGVEGKLTNKRKKKKKKNTQTNEKRTIAPLDFLKLYIYTF